MKQRNQFLLHLCCQIDQQVAAAQNVQLGKRRFQDEILRREDHQLTNLLAHPVAVFLLGEESLQSGFRNVGGDIGRKDTLPRLFNRVLVQIGGEDLNRKLSLRLELFERFPNTIARE